MARPLDELTGSTRHPFWYWTERSRVSPFWRVYTGCRLRMVFPYSSPVIRSATTAYGSISGGGTAHVRSSASAALAGTALAVAAISTAVSIFMAQSYQDSGGLHSPRS